MKKVLLGMLVLGAMASCKKDKDDKNCQSNVAEIAGTYKWVKYETVAGPQSQDIPLDECELNGVYVLNADKTMTYTETATACATSETGTWDVVDTKMTINFDGFGAGVEFNQTPITSWDCSTLIMSEVQGTVAGDVGQRWHFKKQ